MLNEPNYDKLNELFDKCLPITYIPSDCNQKAIEWLQRRLDIENMQPIPIYNVVHGISFQIWDQYQQCWMPLR